MQLMQSGAALASTALRRPVAGTACASGARGSTGSGTGGGGARMFSIFGNPRDSMGTPAAVAVGKGGGGGGGAKNKGARATPAVASAKSAASAKAAADAAAAAVAKANKQTYLDFGQKSLAAGPCPTCGMVYQAGQPEDDAMHAVFHRKFESGIQFRGWKEERVAQQQLSGGGRVVLIERGDSAAHLRKLSEVCEMMDGELGMYHAGGAEEVLQNDSGRDDKAFLLVVDSKVIAACVVQRISTCYAAVEEAGRSPSAVSSDVVVTSKTPQRATCGVKSMWVLKAERRKGRMGALLDCVRESYSFGSTVPKDRLAFTQPTADGRRFMERYRGSKDFRVYD